MLREYITTVKLNGKAQCEPFTVKARDRVEAKALVCRKVGKMFNTTKNQLQSQGYKISTSLLNKSDRKERSDKRPKQYKTVASGGISTDDKIEQYFKTYKPCSKVNCASYMSNCPHNCFQSEAVYMECYNNKWRYYELCK